jgi:hypothetical protein
MAPVAVFRGARHQRGHGFGGMFSVFRRLAQPLLGLATRALASTVRSGARNVVGNLATRATNKIAQSAMPRGLKRPATVLANGLASATNNAISSFAVPPGTPFVRGGPGRRPVKRRKKGSGGKGTKGRRHTASGRTSRNTRGATSTQGTIFN